MVSKSGNPAAVTACSTMPKRRVISAAWAAESTCSKSTAELLDVDGVLSFCDKHWLKVVADDRSSSGVTAGVAECHLVWDADEMGIEGCGKGTKSAPELRDENVVYNYCGKMANHEQHSQTPVKQ